MEILKIYLPMINLITCLFFAVDKWKAVHHRFRIRESVLLGLSAVGGAAGGLLAMHLFRHKTHKPYFAIGLPVMLVVQAVILFYFS